MTQRSKDTCVLCDHPRKKDFKFCKVHKHRTTREMERARYLTFVPRPTRRPAEAKEDIHETKFGPAA